MDTADVQRGFSEKSAKNVVKAARVEVIIFFQERAATGGGA